MPTKRIIDFPSMTDILDGDLIPVWNLALSRTDRISYSDLKTDLFGGLSGDTEILFNSAGNIDGDSRVTYNPTTNILSLQGNFNINGNNIINTGTLTLPTSTDTLIGKATTDTLTNKSIDANGTGNVITNIGDAEIETHTSTKITITDKSQLNSNIVYTDQVNTFGAFAQIFPNSQLQVNNPADTFQYIFTSSAIVADRAITLPLLIGGDTFVMEAHTQTLSNKVFDTEVKLKSSTAPAPASPIDSPDFILTSQYDDTVTDKDTEWKHFVEATDDAGASIYHIQTRIDVASFADVLTLTPTTVTSSVNLDVGSLSFDITGAINGVGSLQWVPTGEMRSPVGNGQFYRFTVFDGTTRNGWMTATVDTGGTPTVVMTPPVGGGTLSITANSFSLATGGSFWKDTGTTTLAVSPVLTKVPVGGTYELGVLSGGVRIALLNAISGQGSAIIGSPVGAQLSFSELNDDALIADSRAVGSKGGLQYSADLSADAGQTDLSVIHRGFLLNSDHTITGGWTFSNLALFSSGIEFTSTLNQTSINGTAGVLTFRTAASDDMTIDDVSLSPVADGGRDLGTAALRWQDIYLKGIRSSATNLESYTFSIFGSAGNRIWLTATVDTTTPTVVMSKPAVAGTFTIASADSITTDALVMAGDITLSTHDIITDTTTGTIIATGATQKLGFFGATPIIQQTTTSQTPATFVANSSGIVDDTATWNGYTIGDLVAILQAFGFIA